MRKKLVLVATDRYSININDFYMFYSRTNHKIVAILYNTKCKQKSWWLRNSFKDTARNNIYDKMDFNSIPLIEWIDVDSLLDKTSQLDFDYLCMGNGSGEDQKKLIEHIGIDRCLFSEYGWLPWNEHFFISRKGVGYQSEITFINENHLNSIEIDTYQIEKIKKKFNKGWFTFNKDFVYVPLQKDINDFKFNFTDFRNNEEFLDFIHEIVPKNIFVLVKEHPLYRKYYNYSKYDRFIDISNPIYNKYNIYDNMLGMICINSTSIIEALMFGANIFVYGKDLFLNKNLVNYGIHEKSEFEERLFRKTNVSNHLKFISLLLERQISRKKCIENDYNYISNHYWNQYI